MKTEKEKMIAGELYVASDPELVAERAAARVLLRRFNSEVGLVEDQWQAILLELMPNCPADFYVEPPFFIDYGYNVFAGEKVYFNADCLILDCAEVRIGSNCMFAPRVQLLTATHPLNAMERRVSELAKPIRIGDDCWFGAGVIVCPGVTIGDRCVIAAGTVVTRDVPSDSLVAGNPGVVKRTIPR